MPCHIGIPVVNCILKGSGEGKSKHFCYKFKKM